MEKSSRIYHQFRESRKYSETSEVPGVGSNRAQLATSDTRSRLKAESSIETDSFEHAHPFLKVYMFESDTTMDTTDPYLSAEEIPLTEQDGSCTSNVPSRVGNQSLNFDFGALALGPDDQSLMTWF